MINKSKLSNFANKGIKKKYMSKNTNQNTLKKLLENIKTTDSESNNEKNDSEIKNDSHDYCYDVKVEDNHIYFYCEVNSKTVYQLINAINDLNYEMQLLKFDLDFSHKFNVEPVIYLHINSGGGYLSDGFLGSDYIRQSKIKIVSIVDGFCASSATLLSMCCKERHIMKNSTILIHQLSGGSWGKFAEMEDDFKNSKNAYKKLLKFYKKYTSLDIDEIKNWLKKDIEFNSKKCLSMGFVDKVID